MVKLAYGNCADTIGNNNWGFVSLLDDQGNIYFYYVSSRDTETSIDGDFKMVSCYQVTSFEFDLDQCT